MATGFTLILTLNRDLVIKYVPGLDEDRICVGFTANLKRYGAWSSHQYMQLHKVAENKWQLGLEDLTKDEESRLQFRFFLYMPLSGDKISIKTWESRKKPRKWQGPKEYTFGVFENEEIFLQKGWLTDESAELRVTLGSQATNFFKSPNYTQNIAGKPIYICCKKHAVDYNSHLGLEDDEIHVDQQNALLSKLELKAPQIRPGEHVFTGGTSYEPDTTLTFYICDFDTEITAVEISYYFVPNPEGAPEEVKFLGTARFGPFDVSLDKKSSQILTPKGLAIGFVTINYLLIKPLSAVKLDRPLNFEKTFCHHWKFGNEVEIGHRGMGTYWFDKSARSPIPAVQKENTLFSFKQALEHGADFVEMDVQLTKDLQVVVYHDYEAVITSRKKKRGEHSYLTVPIKDLKHDVLRSLKTDHMSVIHSEHDNSALAEAEDLDPFELQTFPLLSECFQQVDMDLGFIIEIKFPMLQDNGQMEMNNFFDPNLYVDHILKVILDEADRRCIVLSCFSADICAMLNLKQNLYPVVQLGGDPCYVDPRISTCESVIAVASAESLLGVALDSTQLLQTDPDLVKYARDQLSQIVFVWGERGNSPKDRIELFRRGVHGVIYDRMQENHVEGTLNLHKMKQIFKPKSTTGTSDSDMSNSPCCHSDSECLMQIAEPLPGKTKYRKRFLEPSPLAHQPITAPSDQAQIEPACCSLNGNMNSPIANMARLDLTDCTKSLQEL